LSWPSLANTVHTEGYLKLGDFRGND
jgi:hypothetical protein